MPLLRTAAKDKAGQSRWAGGRRWSIIRFPIAHDDPCRALRAASQTRTPSNQGSIAGTSSSTVAARAGAAYVSPLDSGCVFDGQSPDDAHSCDSQKPTQIPPACKPANAEPKPPPRTHRTLVRGLLDILHTGQCHPETTAFRRQGSNERPKKGKTVLPTNRTSRHLTSAISISRVTPPEPSPDREGGETARNCRTGNGTSLPPQRQRQRRSPDLQPPLTWPTPVE
jgi:hypothetical protein